MLSVNLPVICIGSAVLDECYLYITSDYHRTSARFRRRCGIGGVLTAT